MRQLATKSFNPKNENVYRGYFPLKSGALSHKQGYDLGPEIDSDDEEEGNPFMQKTPKLSLAGREKEVEEFYRVMCRHRELHHRKADVIMSLIAEAGGEKKDFFAPMFGSKYPMHTFRPLRYPKERPSIPESAKLPDGRGVRRKVVTIIYHFSGSN